MSGTMRGAADAPHTKLAKPLTVANAISVFRMGVSSLADTSIDANEHGEVWAILRQSHGTGRDLTCLAVGQAARDAVRPSVARYLGGLVQLRTTVAQGLALPAEAVAQVAGAPYSAGITPCLPLLLLITDRHVDALTLAGTVDEVATHAVQLRDAGLDAIIARPAAPNADMIDETIYKLGAEIWPRVEANSEPVARDRGNRRSRRLLPIACAPLAQHRIHRCPPDTQPAGDFKGMTPACFSRASR
jgi:hypothetical protein